ncbi:MAG: asparaginase [Acidobacteriota bacterium]|nr:asparaginase [Acidobacteriota bacterium]
MTSQPESDNQWVRLVDIRRNNIPECTIHGSISWVTGDRLLYAYGGNVVCYGRSMMKPVMMRVFSEILADVLTPEQKAISVSSHNGDTEHVRTVKSILREGELGLMQTPFALPLMQFGRQRRRPRRWYHSCSGEHAAVLRGCQLMGWPRAGYTLPHHPFALAYIEEVRKILGKDWTPDVIAKDGCGLPTLSMTVTELARMYATLVTRKDTDWIWDSMIQFPDLIGGFNRLDSTIIKSCDGKVIAKEGADGLLGMAILHPDYPDGLGVVIKIAHGWDSYATWVVARWVLEVLGFKLRNPYKLERQKPFIVPECIPPELRDRMKDIQPWDDWDPDTDRWYFDAAAYQDDYRKVFKL